MDGHDRRDGQPEATVDDRETGDPTAAPRRALLKAATLGAGGLSVAGTARRATAQEAGTYGAGGYGAGGYGGGDTGGGNFSRFDTNQNGRIDFVEVLNAIGKFNTGGQVGGQPVGFGDVLSVIGTFNTQDE